MIKTTNKYADKVIELFPVEYDVIHLNLYGGEVPRISGYRKAKEELNFKLESWASCVIECRYGGVECSYVKEPGKTRWVEGLEGNLHGSYGKDFDAGLFLYWKYDLSGTRYYDRDFKCGNKNIRGLFLHDLHTKAGTTNFIVVSLMMTDITVFWNEEESDNNVKFTYTLIRDLIQKITMFTGKAPSLRFCFLDYVSDGQVL